MRKLATATVLAAAALSLTGCQLHKTATNADLTGVHYDTPDTVKVWQNIDNHPNIAKLCLDGVAFATTTRDAQAAAQRVPEWDQTCPGYRSK